MMNPQRHSNWKSARLVRSRFKKKITAAKITLRKIKQTLKRSRFANHRAEPADEIRNAKPQMNNVNDEPVSLQQMVVEQPDNVIINEAPVVFGAFEML